MCTSLGKGADLRLVTNDGLAFIEKKLNLRPRKCPGFRLLQIVYEDLKAAAYASVALAS
jgi:IS30 family transposase